jgi:hypothetical protein
MYFEEEWVHRLYGINPEIFTWIAFVISIIGVVLWVVGYKYQDEPVAQWVFLFAAVLLWVSITW